MLNILDILTLDDFEIVDDDDKVICNLGELIPNEKNVALSGKPIRHEYKVKLVETYNGEDTDESKFVSDVYGFMELQDFEDLDDEMEE